MGDHTNGPSSVLIDTEDANLVSIIEDPEFLKAHDGQEVPIS